MQLSGKCICPLHHADSGWVRRVFLGGGGAEQKVGPVATFTAVSWPLCQAAWPDVEALASALVK